MSYDWLPLSADCISNDYKNYIAMFCDQSTNGMLLLNENEVRELFSLQRMALNWLSMHRRLKAKSSLNRQIMKMIDLWGHPDETQDKILKHCLLTKSSWTTYAETLKMLCKHNRTHLPVTWPVNCELKMIDNCNFLRSHTIDASSTACSKATLTHFSTCFHFYGSIYLPNHSSDQVWSIIETTNWTF